MVEAASTSILAPADAAFRFVSRLADELSAGSLDLPALPEVVLRIKETLADANVTPTVVARLVASEPGLAARVMTLANSTFMNPSGAPITELRTAITRVGYQNVRATSLAYAIAKLRQANELQAIRVQMEVLWQESLAVASVAHALTQYAVRRTPELSSLLNADEAMLVGLVHNIGKLYILSRGQRYTQLFISEAEAATIMRDWHANIGKAVVESWGFAPHLVAAVGEQGDHERQARQADLADVLQWAIELAPQLSMDVQAMAFTTFGATASERLSLSKFEIGQVLVRARQIMSSLLAAFKA